eukprot:m.265151 g.265151  ORF g.265151 m.265151 type:complete len:237 (-) comp60240_c0_seq1:41-751(-)
MASATQQWHVSTVRHNSDPSSNERNRYGPVAVYFGSCNDVKPVLDYPKFDWVFITPEPHHAVAIEHWPEGCCGHSLGYTSPMHLQSSFVDMLGRSTWECTEQANPKDRLWTFTETKTSRRLRVYINSTVEDMPAQAVNDCNLATAAYMMGFLPDVKLFDTLCPRVNKIFGPAHLSQELESYRDDATVEIIPDGDWKPVDGEDFEARTPREWLWEKQPTTNEVQGEEYENLVQQYMS